MCWLRSWSQILLPVFISLFLIQLFISFSENSFSQISRYKDKQRPKTMNDECTAADNCQSCINRKKCFWCSKEKACKKICFPNSECPVSCSFWLNCQVDMFGFLMLLLLVIMVIAFICQFCIYQYYLQRTRVYIGGRPHTVYIPHGGDSGKYFNLFDEMPILFQ
ncbi:PTTG1IP family member 2 [Budorcas taxicolor]|uniref:PTTG1IP family member 2 n=1 Tax=Budorcas taxicolor TaxID=37181 RepID=UPI002284DC08|nr:PTTG1IP family member 2 [Budorcas taxicolor]